MNQISKKVTHAVAKKRMLNQFEAKILNEQSSDKVTERRRGAQVSDHSDMLFSCECDTQDCQESILLSTQEYAQVHSRNLHFVVVPAHVRLGFEEVLSSFAGYCVIKKLFPQSL